MERYYYFLLNPIDLDYFVAVVSLNLTSCSILPLSPLFHHLLSFFILLCLVALVSSLLSYKQNTDVLAVELLFTLRDQPNTRGESVIKPETSRIIQGMATVV